jgi:hypothetical protein
MAIPNSKTTLKQWCKRKLGYPVIDINIDEDQCDDRIDEALQYFYTFQYGGMQRCYLKHKITQADVDRANVDTSEVATDGNQITTTLNGAVVAGATSVTLTSTAGFPKTGTITIATDGTNAAEDVTYSAVNGNVLTTAALANNHANASGVTSVEAITWSLGQAYLPMPDSVQSVLRVLPFSDRGNLNMFDIRYQLRLNDLYDFSSESVIHYQMTMWHLDFLDMILIGEKPIQFNVHQRRLYINMDWGDDVSVDEYIIIEAYRKLDPTIWTDVYNDLWLKKYATALIRRQWGENLMKFNGVTMLGGVTMNGGAIYEAAQAEIQLLEEQSRTTWEEPIMMDIG